MNAALAVISATRMPTVPTLLVLIAVPAKKVSLGMDVHVQVDYFYDGLVRGFSRM